MWIILLVMFMFIILDKTGIMKANTLFMSVLYILSIPVLICAYSALTVRAAVDAVRDVTVGKCIYLGVSLLIALPLIIALAATLIKLCREPIDPSRWDGREHYDTACIKRQRTLLWVAYPITWVLCCIAAGLGIGALIKLAEVSVIVLLPPFWFITICTFGLALVLYGVFAVGFAGEYLAGFALCGTAAVIFLVICAALTGSMLWRLRGRLGWPKWKYILTVVSMIVPVWSLVTLISLSRTIKES